MIFLQPSRQFIKFPQNILKRFLCIWKIRSWRPTRDWRDIWMIHWYGIILAHVTSRQKTLRSFKVYHASAKRKSTSWNVQLQIGALSWIYTSCKRVNILSVQSLFIWGYVLTDNLILIQYFIIWNVKEFLNTQNNNCQNHNFQTIFICLQLLKNIVVTRK